MCNLYSLNKKRDAVARFFRVSHNRAATYAAGDLSRLHCAGDPPGRRWPGMSWGFVLLQQGKAPRRATNVRDDKILSSAFSRGSFEERRCLVPASSFCEPNGDVKPATWHWFALKGEDPRPLFAFPGIWRRYRGPVKKDGSNVEIETYAFPDDNTQLTGFHDHHERMPVLLTREEDFDTWLLRL